MNHLFRLLPIAVLAFASVQVAHADADVKVGDATIELAAVSDNGFRLSVSYDGKPVAAPSIFLSQGPKRATSGEIHDGSWTGLKSGSGELLVDPARGFWTLRDAAGRTLIPEGPIAELTSNAQTGDSFVILHAGCDSKKPFDVYGCGDGLDDSLLQRSADPHVGNGHAVTPFFWSRFPWAALAVSSDDNSPAGWTASQALGRVTWVYPGRSADLYLMPAATLDEATRAYAKLSGFPGVPPRWTFGYLQSRWGWKDRAYIEDALHQFESRKLPVDAFIFDFEWYADTPDYELKPEGSPTFSDFKFRPKLFPDPANQIASMHKQGVHFVGIRKPRLGNSDLLKMAHAKGWILKPGKSGEGIDARCLDFSNPDVRAWYAQQIIPLLKQGVDGWWDDEGEITYTQYYWWNKAEADALAQVRPDDRLWTIDRAFAPGNQRYGVAAWTGDIPASWPQLAKTPTQLLNWSIAGMPYVTCDIGGFYRETTPHLLTRWMEAGVFFPVMRSHSVDTVVPHFPWLFGDEAENAMRKALELRYRLIPYIYSLAHHAHETGVPIMRPLAEEFPTDGRSTNASDEWLLGKNVLAAPILEDSDTRRVYLPPGTWFALGSGKALDGKKSIDVTARLDEIPVYVRAGTVLPLGPVIQHTDELPGGPLEVQIYPGKDGKITMTEDDGVTNAYLKGVYRKTNFSWDDAKRTLSWTIDGPYSGKDIFTEMTISVMDPGGVKQFTAPLASGGTQQIP
jgi:alpha-glucosidase